MCWVGAIDGGPSNARRGVHGLAAAWETTGAHGGDFGDAHGNIVSLTTQYVNKIRKLNDETVIPSRWARKRGRPSAAPCWRISRPSKGARVVCPTGDWGAPNCERCLVPMVIEGTDDGPSGAAPSAASFGSLDAPFSDVAHKVTDDPIADESGGELVSTACAEATWSPTRPTSC